MTTNPVIHVVAGALFNARGKVLLSQRPPGKHMEGYWEFPGGKIEAGETPLEALARELDEEIGIEVKQARPLIRLRHAYPDRTVILDVYIVLGFGGRPRSCENQELAWVAPEDMPKWQLLPADRPIVNALRLPPEYLITPDLPCAYTEQEKAEFLSILASRVAGKTRVVQLRCKSLNADQYDSLATEVVRICHRFDALAILNVADTDGLYLTDVIQLQENLGADGIHLPTAVLNGLQERPVAHDVWLGASCHNEIELAHARHIDVDYAVLGPVKQPSQGYGDANGWDWFSPLADKAGMPVYGLGGLGGDDLADAWHAHGQGIAAINGLWIA